MRLTTIAVAATLLCLVPLPAATETWHGDDPRHDVRRLVIDLKQLPDDPCELGTVHRAPRDRARDITRLAVRHGAETVVVKLRVAELAAPGEWTGYELGLRTGHAAYNVQAFRKPRGGWALSLLVLEPVETPEAFDECGGGYTIERQKCPGLDPATDRRAAEMRLTIPRSCLADPPFVRVGARTVAPGAETETRFEVLYDAWGPGGQAIGLLPPVGPKVRVG